MNAVFRGEPMHPDLRIRIDPRGWLGRPQLLVYVGEHLPVLSARVEPDGQIKGWLSVWGISGPTPGEEDVTENDIRELMGWT